MAFFLKLRPFQKITSVRENVLRNIRKTLSSGFQIRNVSTIEDNSPQDITMKNIVRAKDKRIMKVTWNDNSVTDFPHIYLRDNCQCNACFHPTSKQRLLDLVNLIDVDIEAKDISHQIEDDRIVVTWPDNHQSIFQGKWLRERKFPQSWSDAHPTTLYGLRAQPWTSSAMMQNLPVVDYQQLMSSDRTLMDHFENLYIHGLSIIKEAPAVCSAESGVLYKIVDRVSHNYIKKTHYGEVSTVKNKASPSNLAYTDGYLPLHADLPFYTYQPEIIYLHCIEQSAGQNAGASILSDGLTAVEEIRNTHPDYYDIPTKVKFKFNDEGSDAYGEYNFQLERPIISLDTFGNVDSIRYNNHVRSSLMNAPSNVVHDCYKAYYALSTSLYNNRLLYKMKPGDILSFNNKRVLHGRTAFDPLTTTRWLEGIYVDWDEATSKYRVVRERMS